MKIKSILSIAAFSVAFVSSAAFAGLFVDKSDNQPDPIILSSYNKKPTSCFKYKKNNETAEKINNLLQKDDDNGRERNLKSYSIENAYGAPFSNSSFSDYAANTSEYAYKSSALNDGDLPSDVRVAWRKHMKAWRDYAVFLEKTKNSAAANKLNEESFNDSDEEYTIHINGTWYEVLRAADSYGVDTDKYFRNY